MTSSLPFRFTRARILLRRVLHVKHRTSGAAIRVIVSIPEEAEIDEQEWLQLAATNPELDFLKEQLARSVRKT